MSLASCLMEAASVVFVSNEQCLNTVLEPGGVVIMRCTPLGTIFQILYTFIKYKETKDVY